MSVGSRLDEGGPVTRPAPLTSSTGFGRGLRSRPSRKPRPTRQRRTAPFGRPAPDCDPPPRTGSAAPCLSWSEVSRPREHCNATAGPIARRAVCRSQAPGVQRFAALGPARAGPPRARRCRPGSSSRPTLGVEA